MSFARHAIHAAAIMAVSTALGVGFIKKYVNAKLALSQIVSLPMPPAPAPVEDLAVATLRPPAPVEVMADATPPPRRPVKSSAKLVLRKASSGPPSAPPPPTVHVAHVERYKLTPFKSAFSPKSLPHWD